MITLWFRQDLRLSDNPALNAAIKQAQDTGAPIAALYILDDVNAGDNKLGAASRWWLHHSLTALEKDLKATHNIQLHFFKGCAKTILDAFTKDHAVTDLYANKAYEPWRQQRDQTIASALSARDIDLHAFNGALLYNPDNIRKQDGGIYRVFTPFYKKGCLENAGHPRQPLSKIAFRQKARPQIKSTDLTDLNLLPNIPWDTGLSETWQPGEAGATKRLQDFLDNGLNGYKELRNHMDKDHVSRLSPHLQFGEISPHTVWHESSFAMQDQNCENDGIHFHSELGWREFSHYLLHHVPTLPDKNFQPKFDNFPWNDPHENDALLRWQKGETGYPIVDAAMKELWHTGYMHNRARMIVGSFLVKHLRIHWKHGERWFWDTLVDASLANNTASWQWIAGSGADAAPYFRIFNPITQGEKFDQSGAYTRYFIPALKHIPNKILYKPWEATLAQQKQAQCIIGKDYPAPIVDHSTARAGALSAFSSLKASG